MKRHWLIAGAALVLLGALAGVYGYVRAVAGKTPARADAPSARSDAASPREPSIAPPAVDAASAPPVGTITVRPGERPNIPPVVLGTMYTSADYEYLHREQPQTYQLVLLLRKVRRLEREGMHPCTPRQARTLLKLFAPYRKRAKMTRNGANALLAGIETVLTATQQKEIGEMPDMLLPPGAQPQGADARITVGNNFNPLYNAGDYRSERMNFFYDSLRLKAGMSTAR